MADKIYQREMGKHVELGGNMGDAESLSRQVTVSLSSEQYERLFFQPSAPHRGDLAERFGTR